MVWKATTCRTHHPQRSVSIHLPSVDGLEACYICKNPAISPGFQSIYHQSMVWKSELVEAGATGIVSFQSIYHQSMVWKDECNDVLKNPATSFNPSTISRWSGRVLGAFFFYRSAPVSIHLPSVDGLEGWNRCCRSSRRSRFQSIYHQSMVWKTLKVGSKLQTRETFQSIYHQSMVWKYNLCRRDFWKRIWFQSIYHQSMVWKINKMLLELSGSIWFQSIYHQSMVWKS